MSSSTKAIPASVLAVLKHRWREAGPRHSSFEAVFDDPAERDRRGDPSYYHIRPGKQVETDMDVLTHAEAAQLVREGVFGDLAAVQSGGVVTINEHAQHALTDFCSEVYSAWAKYRQRIAQAKSVCPPMGA